MSPTQHRASRAYYSEREEWEAVRDIAHAIQRVAHEVAAKYQMQTEIGQLVKELIDVSAKMRRQLSSAHPHENPPLTVFSLANPPRRGGTLMSSLLYTIEYRHAGNGKDYYHNFKPGTKMLAMPDGSIMIARPGATVWSELPE